MNIFALMALLPKLTSVLALVRSLPSVISEIEVALRAIEAALKAVQASGQSPVDVAGAVNSLEHVNSLLDEAKTMISSVVGEAPAQ